MQRRDAVRRTQTLARPDDKTELPASFRGCVSYQGCDNDDEDDDDHCSPDLFFQQSKHYIVDRVLRMFSHPFPTL